LWEDGDRVFCRGVGHIDGDRTPVLAVVLVAEHPSPASLDRLAREFDLKDELDAAWAVRPLELERNLGRTLLLLEDPGGEPLSRLLGSPLAVARFLGLSIGIASALGKAHQRGFIHKDIKPANILVGCADGQSRLTGFGIASRLSRERQAPEPPETIAGTLAYMAPEQTGRTSRSIDTRSDLYAFGVTLYQMITGALPFAAASPMEWVHCHIARKPVPPGERLATVPAPLSAIIMKLLAKTPEERYQTAHGVERDLQRCLAEWEAQGRIDDFPPGAQDTPSRLLIPETLYGREHEVATLLASFDRVAKSGISALMLVSGYSGIGKSSIVNELRKFLQQRRGLFASGKFDQYKRDIPYAIFAQAFQGLVRQLLGKNDIELSPWRDALTQALGANGQLMINLVPELALIIGEQPPLPDLSAPEAQSRFFLVFRQFLGVFARPEHPLVLFLDDLQWLDAATLDMFEHLATHLEVRNLLMVGAYRSNEVGPAHPLSHRLEIIRGSGARLQHIALGSIRPEDVVQMIADTLGAQPKDVYPLARIVFDKTAGNPFFVIQFVGALADEGLLAYDPDALAWRWDIDRVKAKSAGDNVVDLMIERLSRFSDAPLQTLKRLACLGNSVEIARFNQIIETSGQETQRLLQEPLRSGLLLQLEDGYAFAHDRVHEATYAMIPALERAKTHHHIGSRLLAMAGDTGLDSQVFEIVSQFNRGEVDGADLATKATVASLNLQAGRKAKASAAYGAACGYLARGRAQLGENGWGSRYELAFALALEHAECVFFSGDFDHAERMIAPLLERAGTGVDKAAVYRLEVELHVVRSENEAAVESGLAALRLLGIEFPQHPSWSDIEREYDDIWRNLKGRPIESIADLPAMTDPQTLAAMRVLAEIWPPSYFTDFNLATLAVCRMVNLSLLHGEANTSNQGYALLGWLMGPAFGRYQEGYRITALAYELAKTRDLLLGMARVGDTMGLTSSWTQPLTTSIDYWRKSYREGVEAGDVYFACYSSAHVAVSLIQRGQNLQQDAGECREYLDFARGIGFRDGADLIAVSERTIASLRGLTHGLSDFNDDRFDEAEFEAALDGARMRVVSWWYWTRKIMLHFLSGNPRAALEAADRVQTGRWTRIVQVQHLDYHYFGALAAAARIDELPAEQQGALRERLAAHGEQLESWARETNSPTFADKHALVAAEIARLEGRELDAERLYEDSIRLAHQNGFLQNEAIANEVAAQFYARRGFEKIARTYRRDARYGYLRWGAEGKVRQLDATYPHLGAEEATAVPTNTIAAPVEHLDLSTVIKMSQAVSGEIVLEKLIETLMRTAVEQAGAERGLLIFSRGTEQRIAAEATTSGDWVTVHLRDEGVTAALLPESVLHYALRTRENVVLDAATQSPFATDPYIRERQARSVLCLPLLNQAKVIGVLYLENNLAPRVFAPARIAVLKLLASQAAISLENTRLYRDLAQREAKIRRLVDANVIGIVIWDMDGRLIDANGAFLRMVQYEREDLNVGLRWFDMTPPEWQERVPREFEELQATGIMQPCEKEFYRKDGSRVPVLIGAAAFEGQSNQGVAYILDLSDLKRAEAEARESERRYREVQMELAHANRVATMGQLAGSIAHDVNQPIAAAVISAQAALRWLGREPPALGEVRQSLSQIVRNGTRASEVVGRIRDLIKKAPPRRDLLEINGPIREVIELIRGEAMKNGVAVKAELTEGLPLVRGDRVQLQQVMLNLIFNAIEAMSGVDDGLRELRIDTGRVANGDVLVIVQDSGPGLGSVPGGRIFEAFYTTKTSGLGMGLSICRSIIDAHGGRLWAIAAEPRGAMFQFTLPPRERVEPDGPISEG
jgi:PAS domain S-box-containing protein